MLWVWTATCEFIPFVSAVIQVEILHCRRLLIRSPYVQPFSSVILSRTCDSLRPYICKSAKYIKVPNASPTARNQRILKPGTSASRPATSFRRCWNHFRSEARAYFALLSSSHLFSSEKMWSHEEAAQRSAAQIWESDDRHHWYKDGAIKRCIWIVRVWIPVAIIPSWRSFDWFFADSSLILLLLNLWLLAEFWNEALIPTSQWFGFFFSPPKSFTYY
jgi:hypothetical protein